MINTVFDLYQWVCQTFVEFVQVFERKIGANVAVHDEKSIRVAVANLVTEMVQAAGGPQSGELLQIPVVKRQFIVVACGFLTLL